MSEIRLRPHHGLCLSFFEGYGYSEEFVANMKAVEASIQETNGLQEIEIVLEADDICKCCPNLEQGTCNSQEKVNDYDQAVLQLCGLEEHQRLSYREFHELVQYDIISTNQLEQVCKNCQWFSICEKKQ